VTQPLLHAPASPPKPRRSNRGQGATAIVFGPTAMTLNQLPQHVSGALQTLRWSVLTSTVTAAAVSGARTNSLGPSFT